MIIPEKLKKGDTVAIVSPAKAIEEHHITYAKKLFEDAGFKVLIGKNALGTNTYFSGSDEERQEDLQWAIDHPEVKAIICSRGGYGCVRIVEKIQWANLLREPKLIVGFSDITVLQLKAAELGVASLHSTMPLNYQENSKEAIDTLFSALTTGQVNLKWDSRSENQLGTVTGELIGGNQSIIYSLLASTFRPDFNGKILFLEDVGEQLYHIDRMLHALKLAGAFDQIAGLVIGGMTDMKDTLSPTNWKIEQLILDQLAYRKIPVAFDAPIGHIDDNRAVICGVEATLTVGVNGVQLVQG